MKSFKEFLNEQNEPKYKPKTLPQLKKLVDDPNIYLGDIDTSLINSFENLFYRSKRTDFSGIGKWNTSKVKNLDFTFYSQPNFNEDISGWDVSKVTIMRGTFLECRDFNKPLNNWNVSKVENMSLMFDGCTSFNQPINDWNVSKVRNMEEMFKGASKFNQPLDKWDVSEVTNIRCMFKKAVSFNQDISGWRLGKLNLNIPAPLDNVFDDCPIKDRYKPSLHFKTSGTKSYGRGFEDVFKKIKPEVDRLAKEEGYVYIPTVNDIRDGYNSFIQKLFRYPDYYLEQSSRSGNQGGANHLLSEEFFKEIKYVISRNRPNREHFGAYEKILFAVSSKYFKDKYGRLNCTGNEVAAEILGDNYARKFFEFSEKTYGGNQLSELGLA